MPVFKMTDAKARQLKLRDFKNEKELQALYEKKCFKDAGERKGKARGDISFFGIAEDNAINTGCFV